MSQNLPLESRLAVVTGASRGIGRAAALELARNGAHIIAVARTTGALEELDDAIQEETGKSATLVPMDMGDGDAIDRLGAAIFERWGKLDIFFGNAGVLGPISPLGHIDPPDFEKVMNINVTANWRCIRSFDPLLKRSDAARVVLVTSGAASKCRAFWGPYSISKAATECLAATYAHECENSPIRVNLINPGPIRTGMRAAAVPGEDPMTLPTPEELAGAMLPLFSPDMEDNGAIFDFLPGEGRIEKRRGLA